MAGVALGGRQIYKKITGKQSDWEGIKKALEKRKEKKEKKDKE